MGKDRYREGRHLVVCDITGQEVFDDEVKRQWDGAIVRAKSWSPRHPQELIRVRPERGAVFPARPQPPDRFVTIPAFGFDYGMHFNFAPDPPENSNYTYAAGAEPVTGTAASFWTFTSDAKWYRNASGVLVQGSANQMVREFDINGNCWGWLIEPKAVTNLVLHSEDLTNTSVWIHDGVVVTGNVIAGPDGAVTGDKFVSDASAANDHFLQQNASFVNGTTYTLSYFVKAAELSWCALQFGAAGFATVPTAFFNLAGAGSLGSSSGTFLNRTIERFADGWYRISLTATCDNATGVAATRLFLATGDGVVIYNGDSASGIYATRIQVEAARCPTSPIRTTASTVTRVADRAYRTLGSEFVQSAGTMFARYRLGINDSDQNQFVARASDNSYSNSVALFVGNAGTCQMSINKDGGFLGLANSPGTVVSRAVIRHASAYRDNDVAIARDGVLGTPDLTSPQPSTLSRMDLGGDHIASAANACEALWLQELDYWPERKSDTFLMQRTSLLL